METKLALLKKAAVCGDWDKVVSIAAKFPRLGKHKGVITQGHAAHQNTRFYLQLGEDPEVLYQKAINAIKELYHL